MILSCNSCGKKFVVPDNAITDSGRLVQCSACGNKWKQFPIKAIKNKEAILKPDTKKIDKKPISPKRPITPKKPINTKKNSSKRKVAKKTREVNLYSPEYLAKKHGIKIKDPEIKNPKKIPTKNDISFGFYSSLVVFLVFIIFLSRTLYFAQNFIVTQFPSSEFYLSYFFENVRNLFEIWKNLITYY